MWEAVKHIETSLSLAAFIFAVITYIILRHQKNKITLLKSLPEDKRWELLNKGLEGYNITQDNLTKEQKFELMKAVITQKAEYRNRIIKATFVVFLTTSVIAGALSILSSLYPPQHKQASALKLITIFGQNEEGNPRVRLIEKSDNNLLLNDSFSGSKQRIRIVTELGNTWLLGDNYQAFKDAINRKIEIKVLMFNFTNKELRDLARYSSQKGEGKQGYTSEEVMRGLTAYRELLDAGAKVTFGTYTEFPWVRFTIFDDNAVSFVIRPMLNISRPQPMYSTDPVIVKMFEGIYNQFERTATIYKTPKELGRYISQYEASIK